MGIDEGKKDLGVNRQMRCPSCGGYGRIMIVVTYTVLSLFFIPTFKWNKKYYVRFDCCNSIYALDPEIGKQLERGRDAEILPEHLTLLQDGAPQAEGIKKCPVCGFETEDDYTFCPKCGEKLTQEAFR